MRLSRLSRSLIVLIVPACVLADEPRTPGTLTGMSEDGTLVDLPLRHTDVAIEVVGFMARTTVEQVFVNTSDHPIEAVYTFPLGHDAAVDRFEMQSGDRVIRGEVHRRERAREIYRTARAEGRQAALLEQERPNVFTQSVANLMPAGEVRVRLRTVELLRYEAGSYELTFPLVVGPRYVPGELLAAVPATGRSGESDPTGVVSLDSLDDVGRIRAPILEPEVRSGHDVSIRVTLETGVPLRELSSPSHAIDVRERGATRSSLSLGERERIPNKDFVLRWSVSSDEPASALLTHRSGVDGYFAFILQPRSSVDVEQAAPKEILFVLDTSGSMSGLPLGLSKRFVHDALQTLGSRDAFNLIRFAGDATTFSDVSLDATAGNVDRALRWLENLQGRGGTEMLGGLRRAVATPNDAQRYRMIVFLSDGYSGNEAEILARVKKLPRDVRIFTIGIGSSVNHSLLDGMARLGGGAYTFIPEGADAPTALARFTQWVTRPYLTDLEIDWGALPVGDWIPEIPRDLFSGQNLTVVGRYYGGGADTVTLRGRLAGRYWEMQQTIVLPESDPRHEALAAVWARSRIQDLLDESPTEVTERQREEVIELALEHGLMSPFTSFVAVDYKVVNPDGESETVLQRVPLPQGVSASAGATEIRVRVTDVRGPLPGATVTVLGGAARKSVAVTGGDGIVAFDASPGDGYTIEVSYPGYATRRIEDVSIEPGASWLIPVELNNEVLERVRVTAQGAVVDLEQTSTSTRFSDEYVQDLPVPGRFYQNVLTLAPGVLDADGDGNPNVHGSRSGDFKTVVNGVGSVDPLIGPFADHVNANSIEEMEVITSGAGVEYSRAQGGFARIVQKQGSNGFEGSFEVEVGSDTLDSIGERDIPLGYDGVRTGLDLAGPIVKDRLWYHLSHEWSDRSDPVQAGNALVAVPQRGARHSDMLTWQVSPRHKLGFQLRWSNDDLSKLGVSSFVREEATPRVERDERILSVDWTVPISPKLLVETVLSDIDAEAQRSPVGPPAANGCMTPGDSTLGTTECLDLSAGAQSGTAYRDLREERGGFGLETKATVYAGRWAGATHEIRFGVDVGAERLDRRLTRRPNLTRVGSGDGEVALARTSATLDSTARADQLHRSLFVEDRLQPNRQVNVTLGLRVDAERLEGSGWTPFDPRSELARFVAAADGLTGAARAELAGSVFTAPEQPQAFSAEALIDPGYLVAVRAMERVKLADVNFSPLLGVSWDPWSDGKTAFRVAWRRYHDSLRAAYLLVEAEPATADRFVVGGPGPTGNSVRPSIQTVDRGLRTPYQDELSFRFEREVFAETKLSLMLVRRRFERQIEQREVNHLPGDYGRCTADPIPGAVAPIVDPDDPLFDAHADGGDGLLDDCDRDGQPDLYLLNPLWNGVYLTGNFGNGRYEGVTLAIDRRQYRSWEMHGSYTWSEALGSAEAFDPWIGDERTLLENEWGFQSFDQRHVFKLSAATITPWGFQLGGSVTWESGVPFSELAYRIVEDAVAPALTGLARSVPTPQLVYATEIRNERRNESVFDANLRISKQIHVARGSKLLMRLDVLNVFDDRSYRIYPGERAYGRSINGFQDATYRFGRRFIVGLEVSF